MQPYIKKRLNSRSTCQGIIITEVFVATGAKNLTHSTVSYSFSTAGFSVTTSLSSASSAAGFTATASTGFLDTNEIAFSPNTFGDLNVLC